MKLLLALLALTAFAAETPDPALSDAEHIQLLEAQLAAERADHAVDKATLDYRQAAPAREKAFASATSTLAEVLKKHGCSAVEIEKHFCQISESAGKLTVVKSPVKAAP